MTPWSYDQIAHVYDHDMGLNADPRSVAWYLHQLDRHARMGGRVLELGCGTGRVTLPVVEAGHPVVAVDRSPAMLNVLRRKARLRRVLDRIHFVEGDMCAFALEGTFEAVICPFSVLAYIVDDASLTRLLAQVRKYIVPRGILAFDMFVPGSMQQTGTWMHDYRRQLPQTEFGDRCILERSKRLERNVATGVTRIDRIYELSDAHGRIVEEIETCSWQRERSPKDWGTLMREAGFALLGAWADFDMPWRPGMPIPPTIAYVFRPADT